MYVQGLEMGQNGAGKALSMTRSRAGPNPRKFFVSRLGREKNYCVIFVSNFSCFVVPLTKVVPDGRWVPGGESRFWRS